MVSLQKWYCCSNCGVVANILYSQKKIFGECPPWPWHPEPLVMWLHFALVVSFTHTCILGRLLAAPSLPIPFPSSSLSSNSAFPNKKRRAACSAECVSSGHSLLSSTSLGLMASCRPHALPSSWHGALCVGPMVPLRWADWRVENRAVSICPWKSFCFSLSPYSNFP